MYTYIRIHTHTYTHTLQCYNKVVKRVKIYESSSFKTSMYTVTYILNHVF